MNYEIDINSWDITPSIGVGNFHIHDSYDSIVLFLKKHNVNYLINNCSGNVFVIAENIKISFDKNNKVFAISVFKNFKGKINNCIGLGSTLNDVKKKLGEYIDGLNECYPTYELKLIKGVEFKLSDDDIYDNPNDDFNWNETEIPIVKITIWDDLTWAEQVGLREKK